MRFRNSLLLILFLFLLNSVKAQNYIEFTPLSGSVKKTFKLNSVNNFLNCNFIYLIYNNNPITY